MSTAKSISPVELLHRKLDLDTLEQLDALAREGYTLVAEESEFRFHLNNSAIGELLADPEEVREATAKLHASLNGAAGADAAEETESPAAHEANLKQRLVSLLGAHDISAAAVEGAGIVYAAERAVFTFKCGADEHTIYDALEHAGRLRRLASMPDPQSYLLLCCVNESHLPAIRQAAEHASVKTGVWEEWDSYPFDLNDLLPTLDERLLAEIESIETLSDFQSFLATNDLQAIFDGQLDAQKRFPLVRQFDIRDALVACAERLGMTVSREADDETVAADGEANAPIASAIESENIPKIIPAGAHLLDPALIRTDGGTQTRAALDERTVADYAEKMRAGEVFPPVVAFYDGTDYWLADGFHRHAATLRAELVEIAADVRQGTMRDAVLYSVGANAKHGLRRTDADKRRAVETLLSDPEWSLWSNREIARRCDVTHTFVGNVREELFGHRSQIEAKAQRGGTEYTVNTENLSSHKQTVADSAPSFEVEDRATAPAEAQPEAQPEIPPVVEATEPHATTHPPSASAGDSKLDTLIAKLKEAGANGLNNVELMELGIGYETVEAAKRENLIASHANGRIFYSWKAEDVVAAIREHGALSRLELEDLGCQSWAINFAKTDGLIKEGKGGKFEIAGEHPQPDAHFGSTMINAGWVMKREGHRFYAHNESLKMMTILFDSAQDAIMDAAAQQDRYEAAAKTKAAKSSDKTASAPADSLKEETPKRPAIEDLLKGRALQTSLTWIPAVEGVSVSINVVGSEPSKAVRLLLKPGELRGLPADILQGIIDRLGIKDAPPPKAKPASKPTAQKSAQKAAPAKKAAARATTKKGTAKSAQKKPAAKSARSGK